MESKKYVNLDWIGIDNAAHVRDIVAMHSSMLHETIM